MQFQIPFTSEHVAGLGCADKKDRSRRRLHRAAGVLYWVKMQWMENARILHIYRCWKCKEWNMPETKNARNGYDYNASRIRWCRIVNVNATIEIKSLVSPGPQNHVLPRSDSTVLTAIKLAMASCRVALTGNTSLIDTFSTACRKKVPTFKHSVTLSNLNRFSKCLQCWKAYEICYKTHATLPTSP